MRVFQIVEQVSNNTKQFEEKYSAVLDGLSYRELCELYLKDGFYATHFLKPVMDFDWDKADCAIWNYERLQKKWAEEHNFSYTHLKDILWEQIRRFEPEVVYNLWPVSFTNEEINNIAGNPKKICWFAAPTRKELDFSPYAVRLTNLPTHLPAQPGDQHVNKYFYPAITQQMINLATNDERPTDVLFYGQYMASFFTRRNALMDRLMQYKIESKHNIRLHLMCEEVREQVVKTRFIRRFIRYKKRTFPSDLIWNNRDLPLFGAAAYQAIAQSKIVVNAGVDFTGEYKVNMRNFEATGCRALLLTDKGIYPEGFEAGKNYAAYSSFDDLIEKIEYYLANEEERQTVAQNGHDMVRDRYSKENQWQLFKAICAEIE
jgi:hypothetical protein